MPLNSVLLVVWTAHRSAEVWQRMACLAERISSDEMVDLVICFPLQQLGRWALYIWTYLCVSPPYPHHHRHYYASDDEDSGGGAGASSSSGNYDHHYCSYCNQNRAAYDSCSDSD